ncbi:hypothetical protein SAPIO_CDS10563 [Scedosporium apiospermum]|uniref:Dihydrolipoamide acetyltransferase component of pyruvate dehydrogenase complex n=1 Tax=Pseudallescheria apiosperma TaxID=563466 RepID=A0A084FVP4_PSEDA|nr:uncharacterized protein SAPIO_CDS10563 [Scedosporium apiospermum]KEZ39156.1 hypothetical protein SAPIO_CDS10563 [Scedosporium apiospermum]
MVVTASGITECQIISWLVKPGDEVQEFDPICEVQSDKASVEITSRFEGRIEKLHYSPGDMAAVGSPLLDIDVEDGEEDLIEESFTADSPIENDNEAIGTTASTEISKPPVQTLDPVSRSESSGIKVDYESLFLKQQNAALVSPAVRRILKEHDIDINEVQGTGKDQRILKEDVQRVLKAREDIDATENPPPFWPSPESSNRNSPIGDRLVTLSPIQAQMFKAMTRSLSIPHFLYTHTVDLTEFVRIRKRVATRPAIAARLQTGDGKPLKLTLLPFMLKALSEAVSSFPIVNSRVVENGKTGHPTLEIKGSHNFGLAVDTPQGLLVPVVRNVQHHSIMSLTREISRLGHLARQGKLKPEDMQDATLVVSNIGSIGGQVVAPVILSPMTAIVAIGKAEEVPVFAVDSDGNESIVKKTKAVVSWSADHRILDGATVARCAQQLALWLENIDDMGLVLK